MGTTVIQQQWEKAIKILNKETKSLKSNTTDEKNLIKISNISCKITEFILWLFFYWENTQILNTVISMCWFND